MYKSLRNIDQKTETRMTSFCMQLFNIGLHAGIGEEGVVKLFRLGKRGERTGPLLIQLVTYTCKNLIMESLYKWRHADSKFKTVIVAHDMT